MTAAATVLQVYLDEDVDVLLAKLLASRNYDCLTVLAAGHLGWNDEQHLDFAQQDSRVVITHNRGDFERLAVTWWQQQRDHAGILLAIRRADVYQLARHVIPVLNQFDQPGWKNCVMYA